MYYKIINYTTNEITVKLGYNDHDDNEHISMVPESSF